MPDEASQPVDLWSLLDEAEEIVEQWPSWQQRYAVDVYAEEETAEPECVVK